MRSGAIDVLVVDSVAALVPRAEIEGDMGDPHMGLQARLMSQALRKLTGTISKSRTIVIFINQIRMKIGVMFGNPETTTGGNALKFYASVRLDIRRIGAIKDGDEVIGSRTKVKVVKNKVAPPFREVEFDILYGDGISKEGELLDLGVEHGIVEKTGAWFSFDGERIGQGRENARDFLREHPPGRGAIESRVREKFGLKAEAIGEPVAAASNGRNGAAATGEGLRSGRGRPQGARRARLTLARRSRHRDAVPAARARADPTPLDVAARLLARAALTEAALRERLRREGISARDRGTHRRPLPRARLRERRATRPRSGPGPACTRRRQSQDRRRPRARAACPRRSWRARSRHRGRASPRRPGRGACSRARGEPAGARAWRLLAGRGFPEDVLSEVVGDPA